MEAPKSGATTNELGKRWPRQVCLDEHRPVRSVPRVNVEERGSRYRGETPQLHFVAEGDPLVTKDVATVLARIVRGLRAKKGGGLA